MLKIISSFLDFIFPPRASEILIRELNVQAIAPYYSPRHFGQFIYLSSYQEPVIQALIKENKFHHNEKAAALLASILEKWLIQNDTHVTILPIPLSVQRQKERGYNQVAEVLKRLPPNPNWHSDETILRRKKHTVPQTSLTKAERLNNMSDVFTVSKQIPKEIGVVILVDDVVTTGTTLAAAYGVLKEALPSSVTIISVALAH